MKLNYFFMIFLSLIYTINLKAQDPNPTIIQGKITFDGIFSLYPTDTSYTTNPLTLLVGSEDGQSQSGPKNVYIPTDDLGNTKRDFHFYNGLIPAWSSSENIGDDPFRLSVQLKHQGQVDRYYYLTYMTKDNKFIILKRSDARTQGINNTEFIFDRKLFFDISLSSANHNLPSLSTTTDIDANITIYFFTQFNVYQEGEEINPSTEGFNTGIYFKLNFSSYIDNEKLPKILEIKRGDGNVSIDYSLDQIQRPFKNSLYRLVVYKFAQDPLINSGLNFVETSFLTPEPTITYHDITQSEGSLQINNLENGKEFFFSIGFMNKFQFITLSSYIKSQTPTKIETFIDKSNCMFFTSGIPLNDKGMNKLRKFRDQFLLKYSWGKSIVSSYYNFSDQYSIRIKESFILKNSIYYLFYIFFFIVDFYIPLMILIFLGILYDKNRSIRRHSY